MFNMKIIEYEKVFMNIIFYVTRLLADAVVRIKHDCSSPIFCHHVFSELQHCKEKYYFIQF